MTPVLSLFFRLFFLLSLQTIIVFSLVGPKQWPLTGFPCVPFHRRVQSLTWPLSPLDGAVAVAAVSEMCFVQLSWWCEHQTFGYMLPLLICHPHYRSLICHCITCYTGEFLGAFLSCRYWLNGDPHSCTSYCIPPIASFWLRGCFMAWLPPMLTVNSYTSKLSRSTSHFSMFLSTQ